MRVKSNHKNSLFIFLHSHFRSYLINGLSVFKFWGETTLETCGVSMNSGKLSHDVIVVLLPACSAVTHSCIANMNEYTTRDRTSGNDEDIFDK